VRTLDRMADLDLAYVEEPLPSTDTRGRAALARQITMPILGDDSCFTLADVVREIELGAIGMVSIKTARTGFSESLRILATAEAHGLTCVVGSAVGGGLSSVAALQFACRSTTLDAPSENSFGLNLVSDILAAPPSITDGALTLTDGAGLGVEVSPEALAEAREA
jgi:L-alanine-DL-glutamate epimerase-like enolase superfamily enzyme